LRFHATGGQDHALREHPLFGTTERASTRQMRMLVFAGGREFALLEPTSGGPAIAAAAVTP
jgi:hypothetical protein